MAALDKTKEMREQLPSLSREFSASEIARKFDVADWTVYVHLKKLGISARNKRSELLRLRKGERRSGKLTSLQLAELAPTKSASEIAVLDGTSVGTVSAVLRKLGIRAYDGRARRARLSEDEILRVWNSGVSVRDIAIHDLSSPKEIRKILEKRGCDTESYEDFGRGTSFPREISNFMIQCRYWRLVLLSRLGFCCEICKSKDYRVLEVNHVDGSGSLGNDSVSRHRQIRRLALGSSECSVEVRCCNCNILHEYERGSRSELTESALFAAREYVSSHAPRNDLAEFYGGDNPNSPRTRKLNDGIGKFWRRSGISRSRFQSLLAYVRLGEKCSRCSCDDLRVLCLNHIGGSGVCRDGGTVLSSGYAVRNMRIHSQQILDIARGKKIDYIELLCANCNILHEYDRGNRTEISEYVLDLIKEHSLHLDISDILKTLRKNRNSKIRSAT